MHLMRTLHDAQIRCVITFSGRIDVERMARAVRLTLYAEPILGCRFVEHPRKPYWERRDDLDCVPLCHVTESTDVERELYKFLGAPIDPYTDIQVQVGIFRSDRDALCIKVNHMVTDGAGSIEYAGLLAKTYRELGANPDHFPQPNLQTARGQSQVFRHVGLLPLVREFCRLPYPRSAWGLPAISQDFSGRAFAIRRIEAERFANIKAYCYQHQASINEVLLTAFYRSLFEVLAPPENVPLPVQVTVNLRRYLPSGRAGAICNLVGGFFPAIDRKPGAMFDDTLAQIHSVMESAKANQSWLGGALYLEMVFLPGFSPMRRLAQNILAREVNSGRFHPFFANIGVIYPQQVDFGDTIVADVSMFPPVPHPPACIISINTFCETMIITTGFCDTATDAQVIGRLLDLFVNELPE